MISCPHRFSSDAMATLADIVLTKAQAAAVVAAFVIVAAVAFFARHRRLEARLRDARDRARAGQQRWELLFEQSPLSVQVFRPDGQCVGFNNAWRAMFGLSDEQGYAFNVLQSPDLIETGAVHLFRKAFEGEVVVAGSAACSIR
jgi:PAS domain-containing protein